jgi:alkylhydroperoxidase family enzyme
MSWASADERSDGNLESLISSTSGIGREWKGFAGAVLKHAPNELSELCRLRIAQLHECEPESRISVEGPLSLAQKIARLSEWQGSPLFDPAERAALTITEKWPWRVHDITDEEVAELGKHLDYRGVIALLAAIAVFDVHCRLRIAFEVEAVDVAVANIGAFGVDVH